MSELQFRIIFLVCSVTVLAAILLYCRRLRRMSSTSSLWQYNSSPVLYNVDVIPSTDKIPVRWPNEKKLRRDFEKSDMTIKMFLFKERRRHFVVFWLMWQQPESASDRMSAHAHHPLVLGHANLVPRSCDPFVHHQGSLTSRRIRKKKIISDWPKNVFFICKLLCQLYKLWVRWFDFDKSSGYTPILYDR